MTLLRYFENGMLGQSMAYHDKIIQCAQESGLDFEVVKNWVGNQRRKRRMEEMQSVCGNQEPMMGPMSPQSSIRPRMVSSPAGLPRQSQVLYFPRSSDAPVNLQGKPVNTSAPCQGPTQHVHVREVENRHVQYSQQFTPTPSVESVHRGSLDHHHHPHSSGMAAHHNEADRLQVSVSPPTSQHNQRDFHTTRSIPSSSNIPSVHSPHVIMNNKCRFVVQQSPPGVTSAPLNSNNSLQQSSSSGAHSQEPMELPSTSHHQQSGSHHHVPLSYTARPISGGLTTPQVGQVSQDGRYYFSEAPSRRPPQYQPVPNMDGMNIEMMEEECETEWREIQIQKVMERIQVYVDQLSKLGCEAFLTCVSKDNFATYLCGTPVGNNYFTKVNKDLPISEFVEKRLRLGENADEQVEDGEEVNTNTEEEEEKVTVEEDVSGEEKEEDVETKVNDGVDEKESQKVIKEGEEVYIVNKEHFIIGRGMLLSAPFERVTPKTAQKEDNAGEDGFIEDKFS
ncbi:hypothetical protein BSL78_01464 [Apostichopus japonicus]|uniref:Homeobox domain-containing protein n=1 Tax=Stichopus japonicus TaxID=307972 RepID=A0A2G8LN10_STIJA|nr:hypothetical protein BSL78_01464 [Apostichopus japonicus]